VCMCVHVLACSHMCVHMFMCALYESEFHPCKRLRMHLCVHCMRVSFIRVNVCVQGGEDS